MKAEMTKKPFCEKCHKVLEEEFVESHKTLGHPIVLYTFGGYIKPDYVEPPKVEKKMEKMKQASGEYAEEYGEEEE